MLAHETARDICKWLVTNDLVIPVAPLAPDRRRVRSGIIRCRASLCEPGRRGIHPLPLALARSREDDAMNSRPDARNGSRKRGRAEREARSRTVRTAQHPRGGITARRVCRFIGISRSTRRDLSALRMPRGARRARREYFRRCLPSACHRADWPK